MKLNEIPERYKDLVIFACKVCRAKHKASTGSRNNCAWKDIGGNVCFYVEEAIEQAERERINGDDVCVACGGYADEGHLCWSCRQKAGG